MPINLNYSGSYFQFILRLEYCLSDSSFRIKNDLLIFILCTTLIIVINTAINEVIAASPSFTYQELRDDKKDWILRGENITAILTEWINKDNIYSSVFTDSVC